MHRRRRSPASTRGAQSRSARVHGADYKDFCRCSRPFLSAASDVHVALAAVDGGSDGIVPQHPQHPARDHEPVACCSRSAARSGSRTPSRGPCRHLVAARGACAKACTTRRSTCARPTSSASSRAASTRCKQAIADRERHIFHQAHHDSLSGLPNRELVISQLRDAIERDQIVSVVSFALDRFNGIVSSLGHRAGDEVIKLAAGLLRERLDTRAAPRPPGRA